jgi:hypothetical protein
VSADRAALLREGFEPINRVTQAFTWGRFDLISYQDRGDDAVAEVVVNTTGIESGVPDTARAAGLG